LQERFQHWNFENLQGNEDDSWTKEREDFDAAAERGYLGLSWLLQQQQHERILLVSHGGILRYLMNDHALIELQDKRTTSDNDNDKKEINARFDNCEVRKYLLSWKEEEGEDDDKEESSETGCATNNPNRRTLILTQIDH
jgi:broad specificity phosphatase PhoE